jgi:hypothetical protein
LGFYVFNKTSMKKKRRLISSKHNATFSVKVFKSQIHTFLGSFHHHKSANFLGVSVCESQIRKFGLFCAIFCSTTLLLQKSILSFRPVFRRRKKWDRIKGKFAGLRFAELNCKLSANVAVCRFAISDTALVVICGPSFFCGFKTPSNHNTSFFH